jgi:hypothetical protein
MAVIQNDLCAGGDIAGRDINNVYHNYQPITWYQRKFQSLAAEIENDHRYDKTIEDLEYFETVLDGRKGLQNKLKDGGHSDLDISTALRQKQKFAKKQEKYKYYESAHLGLSPKAIYSSVTCNYTKCSITRSLEKINNSIYILGGGAKDGINEIISEYTLCNPAIESSIIAATKHLPHLEKIEEVSNVIKMFFN